jgi:hypothetical protein
MSKVAGIDLLTAAATTTCSRLAPSSLAILAFPSFSSFVYYFPPMIPSRRNGDAFNLHLVFHCKGDLGRLTLGSINISICNCNLELFCGVFVWIEFLYVRVQNCCNLMFIPC